MEKRLKFTKIPGEDNPSDAGTKYTTQELLEKHLRTLGSSYEVGRSELAPQIGFLGRGSPQPNEVTRSGHGIGTPIAAARQACEVSVVKGQPGAKISEPGQPDTKRSEPPRGYDCRHPIFRHRRGDGDPTGGGH